MGTSFDHIMIALVVVIIAFLAFFVAMRALAITEKQGATRGGIAAQTHGDVDWSDHVPGVVVETIATVVGATVAMRILKGDGTGTPDFDAVKRLVYVMLRLLSADGFASGVKILKGLRIAWVHREHADDVLEKKALELLGGRVEFYFSNSDLVDAIKSVPVDVVISNYQHIDEKGGAAEERAVFRLKERLEAAGYRDLPLMLYSRSLYKIRGAMLEEYHINVHTAEPEELIRALVRVAKEKVNGAMRPADVLDRAKHNV